MLAKADKPDETRDQLSVGSWETSVFTSHNFLCRRKNNEERMKITVCGKNGSLELEENLFPWGWIQKNQHNNKFQ